MPYSSWFWSELEAYYRRLLERRAARLNSAENGAGRFNTITNEEANSRNPALKPIDEKQDTQLKPTKVDYRIASNSFNHHTDSYEEENLVVRRGQEFNVQVEFDRPYDPKIHQLILQLTFGSRPQESKGTLIRIKESNTSKLSNSSWCMRVESTSDKSVILEVMSPANALVGVYKVFVETKTKNSGNDGEHTTFRRDTEKDDALIVLFNAWCKDDTVHMENESERQEYVMNASGGIWVGNSRYNRKKDWNFGQFQKVCLETCLLLLERCQSLGDTSRGDPIMVSRFLTKMVNSSDEDGGILVGNWSGNYEPFTSPTSWTGSVEILNEYSKLKDKLEGVKYGQCWVFSALLTTLGRTIGIPTRSVTNFDSAHDTDSSTTIDYHINEEGERLDHLDHDSVWNFHVWNECYFKRPDLPTFKKDESVLSDYHGWQAVDATPQEQSQGTYCCGPCPVKAIKEGDVYIPYDSRFVFGEVNGDKVRWEVSSNGEMSVRNIETSVIGYPILTKSVGQENKKDITLEYKYKERSVKERAAVKKAFLLSSKRDHVSYLEKLKQTNDVKFEVLLPDGSLMIGSDFDIQLKMTNTTNEKRKIYFSIYTKAAFYTGITKKDLNKISDNADLGPNEEKIFTLAVPSDSYIGKVPGDTNIKASIVARVEKTDQKFVQIFAQDEIIELRKPWIIFKFKQEDIALGKTFNMTLSFVNPLNIDLENCNFHVETARFVGPDTITEKLPNPVKPKERATITIALEPNTKTGWRYVVATFSSKQLSDVSSKVNFKVTK